MKKKHVLYHGNSLKSAVISARSCCTENTHWQQIHYLWFLNNIFLTAVAFRNLKADVWKKTSDSFETKQYTTNWELLLFLIFRAWCDTFNQYFIMISPLEIYCRVYIFNSVIRNIFDLLREPFGDNDPNEGNIILTLLC